jgi:hypothetical protein
VVIEHERFGILSRTFTLARFDADAAQNEINAGSVTTEQTVEPEAVEGETSGGAGGG